MGGQESPQTPRWAPHAARGGLRTAGSGGFASGGCRRGATTRPLPIPGRSAYTSRLYVRCSFGTADGRAARSHRPRRADRRGGERRAARDPAHPARGGRQLRAHPDLHGPGAGAGRRRHGAQGREPRPAARQDRARRARAAAGRDAGAAAVCLGAADRDPAGGLAGVGEDDDGGQARGPAQARAEGPVPRGRGRAPAGRGGAAAPAGAPGGRRLLRAVGGWDRRRRGAGARRRRGGGPGPRPDGGGGHGRPAADRRSDDGASSRVSRRPCDRTRSCSSPTA